MKFTRSFLTIAALGAVTALALTGCTADGSGADPGGSDGDLTVGLVVKTESNPVWQGVIKGAQDAADEAGVTLLVSGASSESDITGQINKIQDLITQGVDALLIAPNGDTQLQPVLQQAVDAGIPVVMIDSDAGFADATSLVTSDQTSSSTEVNQYLVDTLGADAEGAEVGLLDYPGVKSVADRVDAAKAVFEAAGMNIVSTLPGNCDRATALNAATDMLTANPNIKAIFGGCGQGATGAAQAVQNASLDVLVTGFDGINDEFTGIEAGTVLATILQDFEALGAQSFEAAVAALDGGDVEDVYLIPGILVNKDNIAEYAAAG